MYIEQRLTAVGWLGAILLIGSPVAAAVWSHNWAAAAAKVAEFPTIYKLSELAPNPVWLGVLGAATAAGLVLVLIGRVMVVLDEHFRPVPAPKH